MSPTINDVIPYDPEGRFSNFCMIGEGGMGRVYRAYDRVMKEWVALKYLSDEYAKDPEFLERFVREARQTRKLRHPNIIAVHDIQTLSGQPYISMEFVDGTSLSVVIKQCGALPLGQAQHLIRQMLAGLKEAHNCDVVHRDIKPGNMLIDRASRLKITDFGIAKALTESVELTQTGAFMGSPKYMSPEQIQGIKNLDHRADIYSMGVVLYETVTGDLPFIADTSTTFMYKHVHETPEEPVKKRPEIPKTWSDAILRCLAKTPGERFQGIEELEKAFFVTGIVDELLPESVFGPPLDEGKFEESPGIKPPSQPAAGPVPPVVGAGPTVRSLSPGEYMSIEDYQASLNGNVVELSLNEMTENTADTVARRKPERSHSSTDSRAEDKMLDSMFKKDAEPGIKPPKPESVSSTFTVVPKTEERAVTDSGTVISPGRPALEKPKPVSADEMKTPPHPQPAHQPAPHQAPKPVAHSAPRAAAPAAPKNWLKDHAAIVAGIAGAAVLAAVLIMVFIIPSKQERIQKAMQTGDFEQAVKLIDSIKKPDPRTQTIKGRCLAGLGRWDESMKTYNAALSVDPGLARGDTVFNDVVSALDSPARSEAVLLIIKLPPQKLKKRYRDNISEGRCEYALELTGYLPSPIEPRDELAAADCRCLLKTYPECLEAYRRFLTDAQPAPEDYLYAGVKLLDIMGRDIPGGWEEVLALIPGSVLEKFSAEGTDDQKDKAARITEALRPKAAPEPEKQAPGAESLKSRLKKEKEAKAAQPAAQPAAAKPTDPVVSYVKQLQSSSGCTDTRIQAAQKLGEIKDVRAYSALKQARESLQIKDCHFAGSKQKFSTGLEKMGVDSTKVVKNQADPDCIRFCNALDDAISKLK